MRRGISGASPSQAELGAVTPDGRGSLGGGGRVPRLRSRASQRRCALPGSLWWLRVPGAAAALWSCPPTRASAVENTSCALGRPTHATALQAQASATAEAMRRRGVVVSDMVLALVLEECEELAAGPWMADRLLSRVFGFRGGVDGSAASADVDVPRQHRADGVE